MANRRIYIYGGERFGRLSVLCETKPKQWRKYKKRMVTCKCDCGNERDIHLSNLLYGHTKSCGCNRKHISGKARVTHGQTRTRLYGIWNGMKNRCLNPNVKSFKYYGKKGVKISPEWMDFEIFYIWSLSNGYADNLTIERLNPFGDYKASNCTWIPKGEQRLNRRDSLRK